MSVDADGILSDLEKFRDEHDQLRVERDGAREDLRRVQAEHAREAAATARAISAEHYEAKQIRAERDGALEALRDARAEHAREIATAVRTLDAERSARATAERARDGAVEAAEALTAENADLLARPDRLDRVQREASDLRAQIRTVRAELARLEGTKSALARQLREAKAAATSGAARAGQQADVELHQTRRRLERALDANTRLVAQVAALQEQVRQAEQRVADTRRAMLEHAGRT